MKLKKQAHHKWFCTYCLVSGKGLKEKCSACGNTCKYISHKIHCLSPKASRTRWKNFLPILFGRGAWTKEEIERVKSKI